jgi:hypothetical protein
MDGPGDREIFDAIGPSTKIPDDLVAEATGRIGRASYGNRQLNSEATRAEASEIVRSLVYETQLVPEAGRWLGINLVGALAAILALTDERPHGKTTGAQLAMVAGAGFEPATFRL